MVASGRKGENRRLLTKIAQGGRDPSLTGPFVNPPVVHASTVLFGDVDSMRPGGQPYVYGRIGTPTTEALTRAGACFEAFRAAYAECGDQNWPRGASSQEFAIVAAERISRALELERTEEFASDPLATLSA